jgi:integrase
MPGEEVPALGWPGTKNGEFHRVFLSEPVREIIASTVPNGTPDDGFVFERGRLNKVMRGICKDLDITDPVRPHDLRRTWTTIAASLGVDHKTLDRILNHADRSVTSVHYNQYRYAREDAAAMEKVARHIIDLAEGRQAAGNVILGQFR